MSNFTNDERKHLTTYREPESALIYRGKVELSNEWGTERVGLSIIAKGGGSMVAVGIGDADDVREFVYAAAVRAKLIADGEPLILLKPFAVEQEDAA
jgi:hypothetical protein